MVLITKESAVAHAKRDYPIVQTIQIRERDGLWFAISEDDPPIFVSAYSRAELNAALAYALQNALTTTRGTE